MGIITGYPDDPNTTSNDRFLTVDESGETVLTPASNVQTFLGDGWTPANDSWSFSSYSGGIGVINTNSGAPTRYSDGMWVRFTQATLGTKYGVITSVSTSSITVRMTGGTQLDNEAINNPHYSVAANPLGAGLITPDKRSGGFAVRVISGQATTVISDLDFRPKFFRTYFREGASGNNAESFVRGSMGTFLVGSPNVQHLHMWGVSGSGVTSNRSRSDVCMGMISVSSGASLSAGTISAVSDDGFTASFSTITTAHNFVVEIYG
jgi:hypothetical protein